MSSGSRSAAVFDACGADRAVPRPANRALQNRSGFSWSFLQLSFYPHPRRLETPSYRVHSSRRCRSGQPRGIRNFCRWCFRRIGRRPAVLDKETLMAYVIAEPCIAQKHRVCGCLPGGLHSSRARMKRIRERTQLYIHPRKCIDCGACRPGLPVTAIFALRIGGKWNSFTPNQRRLVAKTGEVARSPGRTRLFFRFGRHVRVPLFSASAPQKFEH